MTLDTPTADRWTALVLFALGLAMLIGGFTMDRLEIRRIHPASIPGLVPMILGATMMLCAALLFASARRALANGPGNGDALDTDDMDTEPVDGPASSLRDLAFAAFYSTVYALLLVGTLPFAVATAIYIAVFFIHFTWARDEGMAARLRRLALGSVFAAVSAYAISSLFQYGFLVRLP